MVMKVIKKGITFSIGTSPDLKWTTNENSENFVGLEFDRISFGTSKLYEIWTKGGCFHLGTNSIHGEEFEVHTRSFLTWIEGLKLKSIRISFGLSRI
jgi:hypothetical protein